MWEKELKYRKKNFFSLIELVLAIGLVGIGAVSIMALFPVGFNAARDAMAENSSARMADQMLHYLERVVRSDWDNKVNTIPDSFTGAGYVEGTPEPYTGETIWEFTQNSKYRLIQYVDVNNSNTYDVGTDILDFEGIMRIRREQIIDTTVIPPPTPPEMIPYNIAVRLVAEISWPARLDYDRRYKEVYCLELFRRDP